MTLPTNSENTVSFAELRSGFWDVIFHTDIDLTEKRGFASYFRSADEYVVANGGKSIMGRFNATCKDCGFDSLILNDN